MGLQTILRLWTKLIHSLYILKDIENRMWAGRHFHIHNMSFIIAAIAS